MVFRLRKGIKSHKGTELTAEDVKYTWDISKNHPRLRGRFAYTSVDNVEVPEPYTVRVNFKEIDVAFLYRVGTSLIVSKERGPIDSAQADAWDKAPYGHGPYKVIKYEKDKPIELEVFEGYFEGVAKPQRLKIICLREASTRVAALLAGEAHVVESLPVTQVSVVRARDVYWQFNTRDKPFSDLKVRLAVNYAMNKEVVVNEILEGFGAIMAAPLTRGWSGYEESKDIQPYPYDPIRAVKLLDEAGYPRGFEFDFMTSSGVFLKDQEIGEAYAANWESIELRPRIRVTERGTALGIFNEGNAWHISGLFQWPPSVYPDSYLEFLFGLRSKVLQGVPTQGPLMELKLRALRTPDPVERGKIYGQLNRMMHDLAILPLSHAQDELYGVNRSTSWVPFQLSGTIEPVFYNHAELVGYGPNYERWGSGAAERYWER